MPFDPTDLQQTFEEAVSLFNQGRYDDLKPLLHQRIVWKMLHHPESIVGANEVVAWLNTVKALLLPQFLPLPGPVTRPVGSDGNSQKISGNAKWEGKKGSSQEDLEYIFTFTRSAAGSPWLLINAFGHIIPS